MPLDYIERASANFLQAQTMLARRYRAQWLEVAKTVDRWSRVVIPLVFATAMCILFGLDFSDQCKRAAAVGVANAHALDRHSHPSIPDLHESLCRVSLRRIVQHCTSR